MSFMRRCKLLLIILIISLFVFQAESYAQCAGSTSTITICTKETYNQGIGNPNGIINLFTLLGVGAVPGGTWTNLNSTAGFNTSSGILNTWQINQSGIYNYTYTVTSVPGCTNNTATITLTLGGYPGVDNPSAVACDNNASVPLFSFLGSNPNPHFNGTFSGGPIGAITGGFFNAQLAGIGTYIIVYTVPAIGSCPSRNATISLTVEELPEAGTPTPLRFCETDDFSGFTNVNLLDQLTGEDGNGSWTDNNGTGQITTPTDSFINIQNIFTNFGAGTYTFTYTVTPSNPICPPSSANVAIIIEPVVDINGAILDIIPSSICFNQLSTTTYTGTITQGANPIPNGTYNITYVLTGANSGMESVSITFAGGTGNFTINPAFVTNIGTTTVNITSIINPSSILNCTRPITNLNDTFQIFETPNVSDTQLIVDDFCLGQNGVGSISDINNSAIELSDGRYIITYTITDTNGISTSQTINIVVTNGTSTYAIPSTLFPTDGNYTITITAVQNEDTSCISSANITDTFQVFPIPDAETISVTIDDICTGNNVIVQISGATNLTNGLYNLSYDISGAITALSQTALNIQFTGGNASFTVPSGILAIGNSTLTITSLVSITNTCNTSSFNNPSDSFEIRPLPDANGAIVIATAICISESEIISIENATVLTDGDYTIIYDLSGANNSTGNQEIVSFLNGNGQFTIPTTLLANGGTTTITIQNLINNTTTCGTNNLSNNVDTFIINNPGVPTLIADGNIFCIQDIQNPTIASLTANITSTGTITWYDAPTGGNMYISTDPIANGTTYYASLTDGTNCEGNIRLEVTVDLTNCPNLFIPDGFSPNNDGLNETFYIKDIDIIYPNFVLEIFNRYGNIVYSGNINTPDFDGKANQSTVIGSNILPTGVYFYILHYNDSTNKKPTQGRLYLSR